MTDVTLRLAGAEVLDALEPLWLTLHHHHQTVTTPASFQDDATSWSARRALYEHWLEENEDAFIVLAVRGDKPVGYAFVEILPGPDDTWVTGTRLAELQTLAVAPAERGHGIGTLLLDTVDARLKDLGIDDVYIAVLTGNNDALRFYQRRGLRPVMTLLARFKSD